MIGAGGGGGGGVMILARRFIPVRDNAKNIYENYLATNVIYKAEVTTTDNAEIMIYNGISSNKFKVRYRNYANYFRDEKYPNETEQSKYTVAKLSIATGHAMHICNCLGQLKQL